MSKKLFRKTLGIFRICLELGRQAGETTGVLVVLRARENSIAGREEEHKDTTETAPKVGSDQRASLCVLIFHVLLRVNLLIFVANKMQR